MGPAAGCRCCRVSRSKSNATLGRRIRSRVLCGNREKQKRKEGKAGRKSKRIGRGLGGDIIPLGATQEEPDKLACGGLGSNVGIKDHDGVARIGRAGRSGKLQELHLHFPRFLGREDPGDPEIIHVAAGRITVVEVESAGVYIAAENSTACADLRGPNIRLDLALFVELHLAIMHKNFIQGRIRKFDFEGRLFGVKLTIIRKLARLLETAKHIVLATVFIIEEGNSLLHVPNLIESIKGRVEVIQNGLLRSAGADRLVRVVDLSFYARHFV